MAKKKILKGYKQQGKRFIPPLKQIGIVQEESYVDNLLPELIWLGLIHEQCGYKFGYEALEAVIDAKKNWSRGENPLNLAFQSAYKDLSVEDQQVIINIWRDRGMLHDIQISLAPLVLLYEGFSLRFIGSPEFMIPESSLVEQLRGVVGKNLDRFKTPAVILHGCLSVTRIIEGTLHYPQGMDIPDPNVIITDPDSDQAKRAGSFFRASAMAEMAHTDLDEAWSRYFWNRGFELSPCELAEW